MKGTTPVDVSAEFYYYKNVKDKIDCYWEKGFITGMNYGKGAFN